MSKAIKLTSEYIEECKREFEKALSDGKFSDGKVTFTKTLGETDRKATIYFTEIAWLKMQTLIREFDKEVAWHGLASRGATDGTYIISDILVYPQEITGSTVTTDQEKYQMWLMNQDDETFNLIKMQGHSHVNMATTPSSVDTAWYDQILEQLDDTMFYIFMIYNKTGSKTIKIYDMAENVLYETKDITVEILDDGPGMGKFLDEAKKLVEDKPRVVSNVNRPGVTGGYSNQYSGYGGYSGGVNGGGGYPYNTPSAYTKKDEEKKETKKESKKEAKAPEGSGDKKRKGRRPETRNFATSPYGYGYDDYDDDWYHRYIGFGR